MYITSVTIDKHTVYDIEIENRSKRSAPLTPQAAEKLKRTVETQLKPLIKQHHRENPTKSLVKINASGSFDKNGKAFSHSSVKTEQLWKTLSVELQQNFKTASDKSTTKRFQSNSPTPSQSISNPTKKTRSKLTAFDIVPERRSVITPQTRRSEIRPQQTSTANPAILATLDERNDQLETTISQPKAPIRRQPPEPEFIEVDTDQLRRIPPQSLFDIPDEEPFARVVSEEHNNPEPILPAGVGLFDQQPLRPPPSPGNRSPLLQENPIAPLEEEAYLVPNVAQRVKEIAAQKRKEKQELIDRMEQASGLYTRLLEILEDNDDFESLTETEKNKELSEAGFTETEIALVKEHILDPHDGQIGSSKNLKTFTREKISELNKQIIKTKKQGLNNMHQIADLSYRSPLFSHCNSLQNVAREARNSSKTLNFKHLARPFAFADRLTTQFNVTYIHGNSEQASNARKAAAFVVKALGFLVVAPVLAGTYLFLEALNVVFRVVIFKGLCKGLLYDKLIEPIYREAKRKPSDLEQIEGLLIILSQIQNADPNEMSHSEKGQEIQDLLQENPEDAEKLAVYFPALARQYGLEPKPQDPLFLAKYIGGHFKNVGSINLGNSPEVFDDRFDVELRDDEVQHLDDPLNFPQLNLGPSTPRHYSDEISSQTKRAINTIMETESSSEENDHIPKQSTPTRALTDSLDDSDFE